MPKNRRKKRRVQREQGLRFKLNLSIVRDSVPVRRAAMAHPARPERRWFGTLTAAFGALFKAVAIVRMLIEWIGLTNRNQFYCVPGLIQGAEVAIA